MTYRNVIDALRVFTGVPVRLGRRHPGPLDSRHAVLDLGRRRLRGPFRRRRARRHAAGLLHSTAAATRAWTLEEAVEKAAMTRLRPVLMTDAGGQPGLRADGLQHGHGSRGAASPGHGRHRRRLQRDGDESAWCSGCFTWSSAAPSGKGSRNLTRLTRSRGACPNPLRRNLTSGRCLKENVMKKISKNVSAAPSVLGVAVLTVAGCGSQGPVGGGARLCRQGGRTLDCGCGQLVR